jgi:hypothetical protein
MMVMMVMVVMVMCGGGSGNTNGIGGCWRFTVEIGGQTGCIGLLFILMAMVMMAASRDVREITNGLLMKAREGKGERGGAS